MPEIAGDLLDYFSPFDARECLRLVRRYLDPVITGAKEAEIRQRYRATSWHETAGQLLAALNLLQ